MSARFPVLRTFLPLLALVATLLAAPANAEAAPGSEPDTMAQHLVAGRFIDALWAAQVDSVKVLFDEELHPQITQELVEGMREQFGWIYRFLEGGFNPFMSGGTDSAFFREYSMANEVDKRSPLILIHVVFPDSLSTKLIGAQVKAFQGGKETRIAEGQTWRIDGREVEVHSLYVADIGDSGILVVQYHETDTSALGEGYMARQGLPVAREAVARGYRDSALAKLEGKPLMPRVGAVALRRDRRLGLLHLKASFRPEEYAPPAAPDASAGTAGKPAEPGKAATKAKVTAKAKKTAPAP